MSTYNMLSRRTEKNTRDQLFKASLTSLLVVKMLTVLVSKISNSRVFLLKKCE